MSQPTSIHVGKTHGEFSVCQFFKDDSYEYVRRYVEAEEAMNAFVDYTNNVASRVGFVKRVIITDGGDCTNAEWIDGRYVYPPELVEKLYGTK